MPFTTQCPHCGVVLNLPEGSQGRRLRCPKCSNKFYSGTPESRPPTWAPGIAEARPASSVMRPVFPGDEPIPLAEGDLRDTFDPSLLSSAEPARPPSRPRPTADASALFRDDPAPRRPSPAERRARPRACPTCGTIVPGGMSLCINCGLDLDTGQQVELADDLGATPPPAFREDMPVGIAMVGFGSLLGAVGLTVYAFQQWADGLQGAQLLGLVSLFGIWAAIHVLRGKSARPLLVALSLGAVVDVVALIGLPIFQANNEAPPVIESAEDAPETDEAAETPTRGKSYADRLETGKLALGIVLLLVYAGVSLYLLTPGVRRYLR